MIVLNYQKSNTIFKKLLEKYQNTLNFGILECPSCKSHNFIRWGFYERNVIFFCSENRNRLEANVMKIQRVMCTSCKKTHALLPIGIVPYKQFSLEVIIKVLINLTTASIEKTSFRFSINTSIIKNFIYDFKQKHLSKLFVITKSNNVFKSLIFFSNSIILQQQYIVENNMCFMQNKLGYLNICPF